jgi:hypothetical protein
MNLMRTRTTWSYLSSLWRVLKLNFARWQRHAVLRCLERTAADIEASNMFWPMTADAAF